MVELTTIGLINLFLLGAIIGFSIGYWVGKSQ